MTIASSRDARVVYPREAQMLSFGDQANDLLLINEPGGRTLFVSFTGISDPYAIIEDGDTLRIPPGKHAHIKGGGAGPYTLSYALQPWGTAASRVQALELGVAVNVDPGTTGGLNETLEVLPFKDEPASVVVGTGAGPLLIANDSEYKTYLTVNSGTDPDVEDVSTDEHTLALGGGCYAVIDAAGTGYEVRATVAPELPKRAALRLVEVL